MGRRKVILPIGLGIANLILFSLNFRYLFPEISSMGWLPLFNLLAASIAGVWAYWSLRLA